MNSSSSSSRAESMKPVILKTGVALIVSATGLILARFMTRREDEQVITSSASNPESSLACREEDGEETGLMEDSQTREENDYEQEILSLKTRFEQIQKKENEMEMSFQNYCNSKDREIMLVELKGMLVLERARLEFFGREVSAMEEENKRIQGMAIVYLKLVEKIQCLRSEQGLLRSKAKNLTRRAKDLSCIVKEKNARMRGVERMLLKSLEELEMKNKSAIKMEAEIKELEATIRRLEEEKKGLQSTSSDPIPEILYEKTRNTLEDYKRLLEEHENLKRERADEAKDMINLKWSNVCLRHALMRYREGDDQENDVSFEGDDNFHRHMSLEDQMALEAAEEERHHEHEERGKHETSRRKRLMKRLKRWVEGGEKGKAKSEERCFGMHSPLVAEPEEGKSVVLARRSCSSA
ncbi:PREDICTED: protein CHUP1, chloroplastic [Tarenaya hassleriana]|uniref:protein CHUP1, chloroplastic n=1 Tax=Tarenaya hassleriana TaxID=28532 RepID=UPI00053C184A|nr:PREDICTED: protein CHUP1, chloroplastic [Tarenaya hassleriana]